MHLLRCVESQLEGGHVDVGELAARESCLQARKRVERLVAPHTMPIHGCRARRRAHRRGVDGAQAPLHFRRIGAVAIGLAERSDEGVTRRELIAERLVLPPQLLAALVRGGRQTVDTSCGADALCGSGGERRGGRGT